MAKRTTIEIYTRQKTLMRPLYGASLQHCRQCEARIPMVNAQSAAGILNATPQAIAELIEVGMLHTVKTVSDEVLICCPSLFTVAHCAETKVQTKTS